MCLRFVLCLFFLPLILRGQTDISSFEEVLIENDDGLNSWLMIEQMHQTSDGAFWFLINEGIYRYNGFGAINVSRHLSSISEHRLNDQQATCFKFDKDEVLWLGRRKGLFKVDLEKMKIKKIVLDKPMRSSNHRNYILQIEEHQDTMYIGTANGLYLVDRKSGAKLKSYLTNGEVPERYRESTKSVKSIYPNIEKDFIWTVFMDGLYRLSKKDGHVERYTIPQSWSDSLSHNFFKSSYISERIYFPSWGLGIVEFDFDTKVFNHYPISEEFPQKHDYNTVRTAIPINDSLAFINASKKGNGLFNWKTKKFSWLPTPGEMKQTWGTNLYLDRDGYIWSTQTGKIFRSLQSIEGNFETSNSILDVSAIYVNNKLEKRPALSGYDGIEFNEYQKNIKLEFSVTKPHTYSEVYYEYKLGNRSWKPIEIKNTLDLELDTGENLIQLRAKSANGDVIAETKFEVAIVIPFFKTIWFFSMVGVFLVLLTYFTVNYMNKKSLVRKLEDLDLAKSRFFNNISHEFRTPLTIMATPLQRRLNQTNIDPLDKKEFELMLKSNRRLTNLVDQMLELSKLESGKANLQVSRLHARSFLNALVEPYEYQAENKGIDFRFRNQLLEDAIWCDSEALQKIMSNLLSNAVKYTPEDGAIQFKASKTKEILQLRIENTGELLSKVERKQLFNRFYQTNNNNSGVGIGLALVKELVELHKGKINIDGSYTKGTAFEIQLPITKAVFKNSELRTDQGVASMAMDSMDEAFGEDIYLPQESEKPLVLLVEDNIDLKTVLFESLKSEYELVVAKDGVTGLEKALKYVPDLIISDIMMPKKDGLSLTKELKENELTSHIPILLLTAKSSEKSKLSGLETGADDYMTKPFNNAILLSKMANMIQARRKLRERYSQEVLLKPYDVPINTPDQLFLKRIQDIMDDKFMDSNFDVAVFCEVVGVSRMQLHRKLKALTGLSTTEFIREQRLKVAAKLLQSSKDITVSEACYASGFNHLSYFTKCFKEAYGVLPSEYPQKA